MIALLSYVGYIILYIKWNTIQSLQFLLTHTSTSPKYNIFSPYFSYYWIFHSLIKSMCCRTQYVLIVLLSDKYIPLSAYYSLFEWFIYLIHPPPPFEKEIERFCITPSVFFSCPIKRTNYFFSLARKAIGKRNDFSTKSPVSESSLPDIFADWTIFCQVRT